MLNTLVLKYLYQKHLIAQVYIVQVHKPSEPSGSKYQNRRASGATSQSEHIIWD